MARRREKFDPRCSLCREPANDASDLVFMWRKGDVESIHICHRGPCWKKAAEDGYATEHSRRTDQQ